jgi:hypothetical protein
MAGFVAGAMVVSSVMGSNAAKSAANTQANASAAATAAERDMFERQVQLQEPFREAGLKGQNRLFQLLGVDGDKTAADYGKYASAEFTPAQFTANQDPGYAFRMSEGMKALDRTAAARGGLVSGSALKGAQRFGQGLASDEYQNAFNRYQTTRTNTLNPFASLAGVAQSASNNIGTAAGNFGQQMGSNIIGAGNAAAAGQVGSANAISSGVGQGINFYQGQQYLNRLPNYNRTTPGYNSGALSTEYMTSPGYFGGTSYGE